MQCSHIYIVGCFLNSRVSGAVARKRDEDRPTDMRGLLGGNAQVRERLTEVSKIDELVSKVNLMH